jgi:hypothetical protein
MYGTTLDLLAGAELGGTYQSFSKKVNLFCPRGWCSQETPLVKAASRTQEEFKQIAECLSTATGTNPTEVKILILLGARLSAIKKMTGCKTGSALYLNLPDFQPERLLLDAEHLWYEGEWPRHVHLLLFETNVMENGHIVEIRRILQADMLTRLNKRLAVYPTQRGEHSFTEYTQLSDATRYMCSVQYII